MKIAMITIEMPEEEREKRIDEWIRHMCIIGHEDRTGREVGKRENLSCNI